MKHFIAALAVTSALFSAPLPAYATSHVAGVPAASAAVMADGEIRRVDKAARKLTIRHGPLENLDMPAMTMVFQVADPAVLDQVKAGDKVRFSADKIGGAYTVTHLEPVK